MASSDKQRRISYQRVEWYDGLKGTRKNLEYHATEAHKSLSTVIQRTFEYNNGEIQGLNYKLVKKPKGIFIHMGK